MSADVEITITKNSAPINVWRFGSLTWNNSQGHYSVRSPIAVRASLINVPAEVSGSYTVRFGYTGPFSVAARGLVPAQTFTSAVNTGDFICHPVTVPAGTTYARFQITMPPPARQGHRTSTCTCSACRLELRLAQAAAAPRRR